MTDETFPHEIWADLDHWIEGPAASDLRAQGYMKYIRQDVSDALIAAACEGLVNQAAGMADGRDEACYIEDRMRDAIPVDPRAALDALLKAEREKAIPVAASLAAAISLLERGGKVAAPSNKMFEQMLKDYRRSLDDFRTLIEKDTTDG